VAREVADAVAGVAGAGRLPLVVGGDCTITLGVIAGFRRRHPDVGLVYLDGDTDVGLPDSGGSGILDSMGVSHLLGRGARADRARRRGSAAEGSPAGHRERRPVAQASVCPLTRRS
jgi:arginase family enzyme